jgi:hypothetical protein
MLVTTSPQRTLQPRTAATQSPGVCTALAAVRRGSNALALDSVVYQVNTSMVYRCSARWNSLHR